MLRHAAQSTSIMRGEVIKLLSASKQKIQRRKLKHFGVHTFGTNGTSLRTPENNIMRYFNE